MAIYLTNDDVTRLLPMSETIDVLDDLFKQEAQGLVENFPRIRRKFEGGGGATLMGGTLLGSKTHAIRHQNIATLFNTDSGEVEAMIEPRRVAWMRTGAASGLATKYMAKSDASVLGVVGTGRQAYTQIEAVCTVRAIKQVRVFSRSQEKREQFAKETADALGVDVVPVATADECVTGCDVVVAITSSYTPVFDGSLLEPGAHVNAAGANNFAKREIDDATITRSAVVAVDNLEQAKTECGELMSAADRGLFRWGQAVELHQVVSGEVNGRPSSDAITLFESQGIGIEDAACYAHVVKKARDLGIGVELPF